MVLILLISSIGYSNVCAESRELSFFDIIDIADEYIDIVSNHYVITNRDELINKIGIENFNKVEERLKNANIEIDELFTNREAVHDIHIAILRVNGNTVDAYWWGKRVKTYGRTNAINTRKLAGAFGANVSDEAIKDALIYVGIGFIPGYGTVASIAGLISGLISWADATTWDKVEDGIADKIDDGEYYLTIDINAWDMDVRVYES